MTKCLYRETDSAISVMKRTGAEACNALPAPQGGHHVNAAMWRNIDLGREIVMPISIFHTDSGSTETWLEVNDDGSVTYYEENSGVRMLRRGIQPRNRVMTGEEAKADWACYASDIAQALAAIGSKNGRPSN